MFESGYHSLTGDLGIVARLGFGGRDIAYGLEEAPVVEPVDPFEGGELHRLGMAPRAATADNLSLEQADDRLGESVVVAIADAADGRLDASIGQALGVADRDVLHATIAVMHQAVPREGPPVVERLFQGIQDKAGLGRARHPQADDPPGEGIDDKGDIDEPLPGRDIGEVRDPQRIRPGLLELPVHLVARAGRGGIADRCLHGLAANGS